MSAADRYGKNKGTFTRINQMIRAPEIRCLLPDGAQAGIMSLRDALKLSEERGLDLVEISPNAEPPVCRIMDYGKFKYEEGQRKKQAKKSQSKSVTSRPSNSGRKCSRPGMRRPSLAA